MHVIEMGWFVVCPLEAELNCLTEREKKNIGKPDAECTGKKDWKHKARTHILGVRGICLNRI
jgi:hypothetical protein